jgi:hypothetical protein
MKTKQADEGKKKYKSVSTIGLAECRCSQVCTGYAVPAMTSSLGARKNYKAQSSAFGGCSGRRQDPVCPYMRLQPWRVSVFDVPAGPPVRSADNCRQSRPFSPGGLAKTATRPCENCHEALRKLLGGLAKTAKRPCENCKRPCEMEGFARNPNLGASERALYRIDCKCCAVVRPSRRERYK